MSRRPKSSDSSAGTVTSAPQPTSSSAPSDAVAAAENLIPDSLSSASLAISMGDSAPFATATVNLGPNLSIPIQTATSTTGGPPSDPSLQLSQDRDLWEKAYQATSQDTKKWIEALPPSTDSTYAKDLIPIVQEIEKKHQSSALRIRVGDKDFFRKDYAPRVISLITTTGDVAIQFAPAPGDISAAVNVSQANGNGVDLLAIAALNGHKILCEKLIELGANVKKQLDHYYLSTALCAAAAKNHVNIVKYLLAEKADPNLILRSSALCQAAQHGITTTKLLLEAGADPNIECLDCQFGSALDMQRILK
ncbi:hypothetical protein ACHAQJ_002434 [Trichoderma viride]